jgi:hypothetical protein
MILAAVLALFDPPTAAELATEQERCYASSLCRIVIDDRPPALLQAHSADPSCSGYAAAIVGQLSARGIRSRIVTLRLSDLHGGRVHSFAVATIDGREWAIDNRALPLCGGVCRLEEAMR